MPGTTHPTIRPTITEDQNLQQHRCQNITYLKFRRFSSHSYYQMNSMLCYLLHMFNLVYISCRVSVICATEPSAYHSTEVTPEYVCHLIA